MAKRFVVGQRVRVLDFRLDTRMPFGVRNASDRLVLIGKVATIRQIDSRGPTNYPDWIYTLHDGMGLWPAFLLSAEFPGLSGLVERYRHAVL